MKVLVKDEKKTMAAFNYERAVRKAIPDAVAIRDGQFNESVDNVLIVTVHASVDAADYGEDSEAAEVAAWKKVYDSLPEPRPPLQHKRT
jgi:hypothetical protein